MKKAYITLLSMIVLGALFSVLAVLLLDSGLSSNLDTFSRKAELKARSAANACIERTLYDLLMSKEKNSGHYKLEDSSCSYQLDKSNNTTIYSVGRYGDYVFRIIVVVDKISPKIHIESWRELADF